MKSLLACTVILGALAAQARIINVSDHGIAPGKDNTFALNRLLESIGNESGVTLNFPKGTYDFHQDNAAEVYRAVSNHDNGLKRIIFPLFDHKDITIEGNGSLFLMHGRVVPFTLERASGITLKNFSIDWEQSFHAELKCIERDIAKQSAVFECDETLYPNKIDNGMLMFDRMGQWDPIGANMVWDKDTHAPIYNTDRYAVQGWKPNKVSKPGKNKIKLEKCFKKEPPPVGSTLVVYGVHPTSRLCPAIHITNSKNVKIENVTVHDAGGMGLIVERTENIELDGMKVTSNSQRVVSTRADATHFIGCKGLIKVENCVFEHMLDDAINVHGAYVPVVEYLGNNQFLCNISHFQQWGLIFAEPGDRIALMDRSTVLPVSETTVTDIKILNEHRFVLTVAGVPEKLPEIMSVENLTWNPDLEFRNNIVRENRARSILVTTKGKVIIENNYLSSQMHGILIEGDNNKWYESGAVQDVMIRNNEFVNPGYARDNRYPLLASPLFTKDQRMGEGRYHRNITFENNTVRSFNGHLVEARSVDGLKILNNKLIYSDDYPKAEEGETIELEYCNNVEISGNSASGFDHPITIKTEDTENLTIGKNKGFTAKK
ncbi:right-handed parallel beta-helix repeat-containing protein [Pontiella agarivorans]|uniref:Right-handed parallel beta-helix repeat-containing protein n=1 Tax=Pontiella agarivorans TaxID=3038953 RepID=A0ABU5MTA8_9BACT|nr:right-handed parallel beta-helix repeat-containing protein [Pontiella agarivorans]MDZ8117455.1 right-handed parallel beta-helix repeat-containing protein [Pontiella agarivorans]